MKLFILPQIVLIVNISAAGWNPGHFEYNNLLDTWQPKPEHSIWTEGHGTKHSSYTQRAKEGTSAERTLKDQVPRIATQHVFHDHDVDHHLTYYPYLVHKRTIPRLIVYVQTLKTPDGKPLSLFPLLENKTGITHVILASVHLHQRPGEIRLNDNAFSDKLWDPIWGDVKVLQKSGVRVMMMLGGAAGGTYGRLNGTDEEFYKYYYPLRDLIKRYNIDGLDLDIEENVPLSTPIRLLTALHRDLGPSFILTMAPLSSALAQKDGQNLSGFSYFSLDEFATVPGSDTKLVHWFNAQFYGHFPRGSPSYERILEQGWEPERVVMGVLDCADDGQPNGFVHVEDLGKTVKSLRRETRDSFGGVCGWEYWNAGTSECEKTEPWMWVKKVGRALFEDLSYLEKFQEEVRGEKGD
ncbi:uncharacterized protein RCO7_05440 [Rhynchosporium graminicola]|uniref:GH18 domain-containing protein n=1 Tax=Rhynchosporium graminicola TaxID=2792576 RepID=A0A1E1KV22_9HELO|nr:uncharacterized protein RCO7_05440 [Rhynchosporium commune]